MRRSLLIVMLVALMVMASAGAALAGEITGNGKVLHVQDSKWGTGLHARSACAYSGQEDLQFFYDDEDEYPIPADQVVKGDPAHAQSWGQIPKEDRDFLATLGLHPGMACNPTIGEPEPPA